MPSEVTTLEPRPAKAPLLSGSRVAAIVPTDVEQVFRLAKAIALAGWAPKSYLFDPKNSSGGYDESKIAVGILHGMELGLTPIAALQSIAVINGTPSIYGDGALAVVQASGLMEDFREEPMVEGGKVVGYRCTAKRRGVPTPFVQDFTLTDAARAKLIGKPGPWQEYQGRMLQMRARAWTLRAGFADVLRGMSIAEEAQDIHDLGTAREVKAEPPPRPALTASAALDAFAGEGAAAPPEPQKERVLNDDV